MNCDFIYIYWIISLVTYWVELIVICSCVLGCGLCSLQLVFLHKVVNPGSNFCLDIHYIFSKQSETKKLPSNKQQERGILLLFKFSTLCLQSISLKLFWNVFKSKIYFMCSYLLYIKINGLSAGNFIFSSSMLIICTFGEWSIVFFFCVVSCSWP